MPLTQHTEAVAKMQKTPGRWFKVTVYGSHASAQAVESMVRRGKGLKAFDGPPGTYEASVRNVSEVWARYVKPAPKRGRKT